MAGETVITLQGNLVDDPELRFTPAGHAVAKFRVASTPRTYDKQAGEWRDGDPLFLTVTAWRKLGENIAESLTRGATVIIVGRLKQRSYETTDGNRRTVYEVEADNVAPSLLRATAVITKNTPNGQGAPRQQGGWNGQQRGHSDDPWATQQPTDRAPF